MMNKVLEPVIAFCRQEARRNFIISLVFLMPWNIWPDVKFFASVARFTCGTGLVFLSYYGILSFEAWRMRRTKAPPS